MLNLVSSRIKKEKDEKLITLTNVWSTRGTVSRRESVSTGHDSEP